MPFQSRTPISDSVYEDMRAAQIAALEEAEKAKPGDRGYQAGCGCCSGPVHDRCCCHMHQDIPRGLRAHKCSLHAPD